MDKLEKEQDLATKETKEVKVEKSAKELKQEAIKAKYAKYARQSENELKSNRIFKKESAADLDEAFAEAQAADNAKNELSGANPSAKYLVQKFEATPSASQYEQIIAALAPNEEFIPVGKGCEYGLVNGLAVNKLDYNNFIPQERNDMGNYTQWDTIDLPSDPDDFDKVELSIAMYLYLPYYLSGKIDELVAMLKPQIKAAFIRRQAKWLLDYIKTIFRAIHAKASSTEQAPTNRLVGTTGLTQIDAMKEFLDFETDMLYDNIQFNFDTDKCYNSLPYENRVYICEKQTYNNFKKYVTTFLSNKADDYFKLGKWIVLPTSIYNNLTASASRKGSIEKIVTLSEDNRGVDKRVEGALLILDNRAMKRVYNYFMEGSEYYLTNDTTQLVAMKNWAMKFLKWGQCAVYENAALESAFVVPTKEAN